MLGSAIGRLFAHLLQLTGIVNEPDAPLYSLLGAAGFFTGACAASINVQHYTPMTVCWSFNRIILGYFDPINALFDIQYKQGSG